VIVIDVDIPLICGVVVETGTPGLHVPVVGNQWRYLNLRLYILYVQTSLARPDDTQTATTATYAGRRARRASWQERTHCYKRTYQNSYPFGTIRPCLHTCLHVCVDAQFIRQ
jgi:hypothetical protein